ncbi:MAG: histidinol dehydrogenase [Gemmatimonadota bacterium]|nr:histidinol dehydrogenase [Gemmatimonadota bacterium]
MSTQLLPNLAPRAAGAAVPATAAGADAALQAAVRAIVDDVRTGGMEALQAYAAKFDGWQSGAPWLIERAEMRKALDGLDGPTRDLLERTAGRIRDFAKAQRAALTDIVVPVAGGRAGHTVIPMSRAGCYAPAGRHPLPSSLLMTAVTARAAGVPEVIVASPRPAPVMLAAAAIADVDALLAVGGAQAIAAMAYGVGVPACDIVVGPGNRWVTESKRIVSGDVAIDMLAGPSELVVVADGTADAAEVAADLIAQAEHDTDAYVALVTTDARFVDAVRIELAQQLATLPTSVTARSSLQRGATVLCANGDEIVAVCDALAPEHLQLSVQDPEALAARIKNAGALFVGSRAAQVFGDYGIGGNHVLPTGQGARFTGGLSALTFLRVRSWLALDDPTIAALDAAAFARLEGLEGHARAAERRLRLG